MPDKEMEQCHLEKANHHIALLEENLERQGALVETLQPDGLDDSDAVHLLSVMTDTLQVGHEHRR